MTSQSPTSDTRVPIRALLGSPPDGWLDPRSGPVRQFWGTRLGPPHPRWWVFGAALARAPFGTSWSQVDFSAAGSSIDRAEALTRALGETLERHASLHSIAEVVQEPAVLLENPLASRFPRCAAHESCPPMFKGEHWDIPVDHVRAEIAATGINVMVPTPFVHLGYTAPTFDLLATYPISTGTAFAPQRHDALWRGLCEAAERDAIMLFWFTQSGFRRITLETSAPPALERRTAHLTEVGLDFDLFDITTDFAVPTVLAVIRGPEYPYITVGASCQDDPVRACSKAFDEAVSVRYSLSHDKWRQPVPSFTDFGWVRRLEDHMVLYGNWADCPALEFLEDAPRVALLDLARRERPSPPRSDHDFVRLSQRLLRDFGLTVLVADLPCADTAPYGHVVKVLVPEFMPLSQDHNARWLDTPRLKRRLDESRFQLNPYPHPFA